MHELAVCQALIEMVESIASDKQARSVTEIHLCIGPLSGVESKLLENAFPVAAAGTLASDAVLHLTSQAVKVFCERCGTESSADANRLVCQHCDNWRTRLISGDELLLERVCLETAGPGSLC